MTLSDPRQTTQPAETSASEVRLSLPERAYREIKRRILDNEIASGSYTLEKELSEILDMSRTPVREAMVRLANEGLVEIRPRHGMRVLPVSTEDMIEIYDILTALESEAAELLAHRGIDDQELEQLMAAVDDMDAALANGDLQGWARADERFHLLLVAFCGNRRLANIVNNYWDQSHRVRMLTLKLRPTPHRSNDDHRAVVAAIRAQDVAAAREHHRDHRQKSGVLLVSILEKHGLSSV